MRNSNKPLAAVISALLWLTAAVMLSPGAVAAAKTSNKSHDRSRHSRTSLRHPRQRRTRASLRGRRRAGRTVTPAKQPKAHEVLAPVAPTAAVPTAAEVAAANIAAVLATPCVNTEITPEPANIALADAAVLCLINRERAEHSEQPLALDSDLQLAAEEHSRELIEVDYFAHVSPSGVTPVQRIRETGYIANPDDGYVIGENLAWGTYSMSTPQSIVSAWIASPGHLANILEAQYTQTGIAIVPEVPAELANGAPGATYAQEFGVLIG